MCTQSMVLGTRSKLRLEILIFIEAVVVPYVYVDIDLGHQHWFRQWLVAWEQQAITWTDVDFSKVRCCDIHLRAISQTVLT